MSVVVGGGGECTFQCTTNVQQGARQTNKSHQRWVGAVAAVNSKRKTKQRNTKQMKKKNKKQNVIQRTMSKEQCEKTEQCGVYLWIRSHCCKVALVDL